MDIGVHNLRHKLNKLVHGHLVVVVVVADELLAALQREARVDSAACCDV